MKKDRYFSGPKIRLLHEAKVLFKKEALSSKALDFVSYNNGAEHMWGIVASLLGANNHRPQSKKFYLHSEKRKKEE